MFIFEETKKSFSDDSFGLSKYQEYSLTPLVNTVLHQLTLISDEKEEGSEDQNNCDDTAREIRKGLRALGYKRPDQWLVSKDKFIEALNENNETYIKTFITTFKLISELQIPSIPELKIIVGTLLSQDYFEQKYISKNKFYQASGKFSFLRWMMKKASADLLHKFIDSFEMGHHLHGYSDSCYVPAYKGAAARPSMSTGYAQALITSACMEYETKKQSPETERLIKIFSDQGLFIGPKIRLLEADIERFLQAFNQPGLVFIGEIKIFRKWFVDQSISSEKLKLPNAILSIDALQKAIVDRRIDVETLGKMYKTTRSLISFIKDNKQLVEDGFIKLDKLKKIEGALYEGLPKPPKNNPQVVENNEIELKDIEIKDKLSKLNFLRRFNTKSDAEDSKPANKVRLV